MKYLTFFGLGLPVFIIVIPYLINIVTQFPGQYTHEKGGIILVTGASSGIGLSAAIALKKEGYLVVGGVRKETDAKMLANEYNLRAVILDVTKEVEIESAKQKVLELSEETGKKFIALVNNAGVSRDLPVELQPKETIRFVYGVNVFGLMDVTREFLPLLRWNKGRVINIGSVAGLTAVAGGSTYHGTKHAVEAFSDCLRRELYPHGVSVALVEPAYVESKIFGKSTGGNDPTATLTNEEYKLYNHVFANRKETMKKVLKTASPTTVTDDAIIHAIKSPYPKTRYIVANVLGLPANVIVPLLSQFPDRVADVIFFYATQKGYGGLVPLFVTTYICYGLMLMQAWKFVKYIDSKILL